jgi:hypothetical protein
LIKETAGLVLLTDSCTASVFAPRDKLAHALVAGANALGNARLSRSSEQLTAARAQPADRAIDVAMGDQPPRSPIRSTTRLPPC